MEEAARAALAAWLRDAAAADEVTLRDVTLMSGGAIQQNWRVAADIRGGPHAGAQDWVLRTDSAATVSASRSRAEEFALLRTAHAAGVKVPEPLFLCADRTVLGRLFFVMRLVRGIAAARQVARSDTLGGGREHLAEALGQELARIHAIRPPRADLPFLPPSADGPEGGTAASRLIATLRARLEAGRMPRPVLEWGLRHMELHAPPPGEIVLCHNDFRTGNYMVDEAGVVAVLDWEFAGWGDPHEDIGWFCARCWRQGGPGEAGGVGSREAFYRGYEAETGRRIDRDAVPYWELAATLRWAVIAAEQAERHLSGREHSLELALTGHVIPELEVDVMEMTRPRLRGATLRGAAGGAA